MSGKFTDIVKHLEAVKSLWDLDLGVLAELNAQIKLLGVTIAQLDGKEFIKVKAYRVHPDKKPNQTSTAMRADEIDTK